MIRLFVRRVQFIKVALSHSQLACLSININAQESPCECYITHFNSLSFRSSSILEESIVS